MEILAARATSRRRIPLHNADTVSIGSCCRCRSCCVRVRPEELVADLRPTRRSPRAAGMTLREYAAHLIPEAGTTPCVPGRRRLLIAGDAGP